MKFSFWSELVLYLEAIFAPRVKNEELEPLLGTYRGPVGHGIA